MSPSVKCSIAWTVLIVALLTTEGRCSRPCDQWQLVNPLPATSDFLGAAHGNGRFILVGRDGTIVSSPDEVSWRLSDPVTTRDLYSVAWTGDRFVAVGARGATVTSEDGHSWTLVDTPAAPTLRDLAMGPRLVAVGSQGAILSSPDGLTWTARDSGVTTELRDVTWTGTEFLAVGDEIEVLASPDGISWSMRETDNGGPFTCIASNGSTTVAVAEDATSRITTDGRTWIRGRATHRLSRIVWAGDRFIAVGRGDRYALRYSFDGLEWHWGQSSSAKLPLNVLATDERTTVAGGPGGTIAVTRDGGEHVKPANTLIGLDLYGLATNGDTVVISAGTPTSWAASLLVSDDGLNWEIVYNVGAESLNDVAVNASVYVTVGVIDELWDGGAMIMRSPDGRSWTGAVGSVTGQGDWPWEWHSISWDGGRFVASGSGGAVAISPDASRWHLIGGMEITDHTLFGVASDGQSLVAVGSTGAIAVSHDGQTLTMAHPGYEDNHLFDVAWGNGIFAAVGSEGTILTSTTGDQWQEQHSGTTVDLRGVRFTSDRFVVVGDEGKVLTSADGVLWQPAGRAGAGDLLDVIEFSSELIAVGRHGLVMRSACADPDQPPTPRFAWRPALPEAGTPVHFVDLSPGDPIAWQWDFGDGGTTFEPNPTHVFDASGDWPVSLTAANEHGSATASSPVTVRPFCGAPPAAELTAPPTVQSGEPYELSWNETLLPGQHGLYVVYESNAPDFQEQSGSYDGNDTSAVLTRRWSEGGSFFHRMTATKHCPDGHYRSPVSNTVRVDIEPDVTDLGDHVKVIAAAAHGPGLKNTSWVSDIVIHNPDRHAAPAYLYLLPRDGDNPPAASARHWIQAGQSLALDDAVAGLLDPGAGALLVASDRPLMVGSRTFNDQPGGSYGQFIEGVSIASPDGGIEEGRLIQLTRNDRTRTNLALANPRPDDATVTVDIHDTDGDLLRSKSYALPGLSSVLDTGFLRDIGPDDLEDAYAVLSADSPDASWVALASVIDNESGDPIALPTLYKEPRHRVVLFEDQPLIRDHRWTDLLFAEGIYLAATYGALAWSPDGLVWHESMTFEHDTDFKSLAWNGSQILAVSDSGVYSSDDGISWTAAPVDGDGYHSIAWDGTRWVGLGDSGDNWGTDWTEVGFSDDGLTWDRGRIDGIRVYGIIWGGDRFVAQAPNSIATSLDGLNWQIIKTFDAYIGELAWSGRQLIALGRDEIFTSTDFEDFIGHPNTHEDKRVVWAGDHWVVSVSTSAHGEEDAFLLSDDGVNWTSVANPGPWLHPTYGITWDGNAVLTVDFRRRLTWLISDGPEATIPAVAHLNGHGGSQWRSDVELHNPGSEPLVCSLELIERDTPGLDPVRAERTIGATSSLRLTDVLATDFGFVGAGVLKVRSANGAVLVSSRTYADDPAGTYGQFVPALRTTDAIHHFETGRLIQLRHSPGLGAGFRTNIGLVSRCSEEMGVRVDLHLGSGELLGTETATVPPRGAVQLNRVFEQWTDDVVADGFAVLTSTTPTCAFLAYASVIDNRTHDPILVPARPWPAP